MLSLLIFAATGSPAATLDQRIDARLIELSKHQGFVGASAAVVRDGKVVYAKGWGKTCLAAGRRVRPSDRFSIGSVTKEFTSACAMKLVEDGKLSLDDPVEKYISGVTSGDRITIRQLMQHISGVRDYYPLDYVDREMSQPTTASRIVAKYGAMPLDFEPGSRWSYSNTGYTILGLIIEKIAQRPLGAFMSERIFQPLGLTHTTFEARPTTARGVVQGYDTLGLEPPAATEGEGANWAGAAGAIATTPSDLALWDVALMEGRVLRPESMAQMTAAGHVTSGASIGYGFGLGVGDSGGEPFWAHGGGTDGFLSENIMLPRRKSAIVVLSNCTQISPQSTAWAIAADLTDGAVKSPTPAAPADNPVVVPKIAGPKPEVATKALLADLRRGTIHAATLTEDFRTYLTPSRRKRIAHYLTASGAVGKIKTVTRVERGGMEVAVLSLTLGNTKHGAVLYRETDGKIAELYLFE